MGAEIGAWVFRNGEVGAALVIVVGGSRTWVAYETVGVSPMDGEDDEKKDEYELKGIHGGSGGVRVAVGAVLVGSREGLTDYRLER